MLKDNEMLNYHSKQVCEEKDALKMPFREY